MKQFSPDTIIERVGGNGVLVVFDLGTGGRTVVIRCELDALPIMENDNLEYHSVRDGISHKCGHDGHMAIVARVASMLRNVNASRGKVLLLFQPAEETGMGAKQVLDDPVFGRYVPDHIIALHNLPGFELNSIIIKPGLFNAEVISVIIGLKGKTSHASEPENGVNPALAISALIQAFEQLQNTDSGEEMRLLTPIQIEMGEEAFGVSAGDGVLKYTVRAWSADSLRLLKTEILEIANEVAERMNLDVSVEWVQHFAACHNSEALVDVIVESAQKLDLAVVNREEAFRFGEDFGLFTQRIDGAMFGLGAGVDTPPLHSDVYDFPDELIETGAEMFVAIIERLLEGA